MHVRFGEGVIEQSHCTSTSESILTQSLMQCGNVTAIRCQFSHRYSNAEKKTRRCAKPLTSIAPEASPIHSSRPGLSPHTRKICDRKRSVSGSPILFAVHKCVQGSEIATCPVAQGGIRYLPALDLTKLDSAMHKFVLSRSGKRKPSKSSMAPERRLLRR